MLFEYVLPEERIAQRPAPGRASRLLHVMLTPEGGCRLADRTFSELPELLQSDDLLVLNDSKVCSFRFFPRFGEEDREAELLLLERAAGANGQQRWQALARPMRRFKEGTELTLGEGLRARVLGRQEGPEVRLLVDLWSDNPRQSVDELIEKLGNMPIPPYIRGGRSDNRDKEEYQTTFARFAGSAAAPTAGLHFTDAVFKALQGKGISWTTVTHHVGPASFLPVREGDWQNHVMSRERYTISSESAEAIARTRRSGSRVIAVGTTSVRALESFCNESQSPDELLETELFITPGYRFQMVDSLITNFHQPQSTHLLLVAAFAGKAVIEQAYRHALAKNYRFLSYGDAMLLDRRSLPQPPLETSVDD